MALQADAGILPKTCTPDGLPQNVASGLASPARMAVVHGDVFLTLAPTTNGSVVRLTTTDGGTTTEIAHGQDSPSDILVDGDIVYWLNLGDGAVHGYSRGYGTQRIIEGSLGARLQSLALDVGYLYIGNTDGPLVKIPKAPVERRDVVVVTTVKGTPAIATDDQRVYFVDSATATVRSIDKLGNDARAHGGGTAGQPLVVDGGVIFSVTTDGTTASVIAQSIAGGDVTTLSSSIGAVIERMITDADRVYWTETTAGRWSLKSVAKSGGPAFTVADDLGAIADIGVDDKCAYWVERGESASLMRAPKGAAR